MYFWVLTVSKADKEYHHEDKTFAVDGHLQDSILHISLSGRLDTLTAPDLLSLYQGIDQDSIKGIDIDFENLDYISSAGLRVLLIMYKAHSDSFNLTGINKDVMDIFETTGFASIFGL